MSTGSDCSTSSIIGIGLTIVFGVVYGLVLVAVSLYSYRFLMKHNTKFTQSNCIKKLKSWIRDVYKRRGCYLPLITHLADTVTDVAVIVQFGELAGPEYRDGCGINMLYLFALSIFALVFYRTLSSFLIYQIT
eukprot:806408_1